VTKKTITDTSKLSSEERLVTALLPSGIRVQEARGQSELMQSAQLPTKGLLGRDRAAWEALGIKILDANAGTVDASDALFCHVELPAGWKKVPTDHAMWTDLVDATDKLRGRIFYKAAFYDRDAFITLVKDAP
jgi:hypothetical protein